MADRTSTMPRGWKRTTLGEAAEKIGDGLHGTPEYSSSGEYYFVNGNNIKNGKIIIKGDTKRVDQEEFEKHKKDLGKGTTLLSINGTIGNLAKYKNEKCILGKSAAYINVNRESSHEFIYYLMLDNRFQNDISKNANGSTIKNVSLAQLRNYTFFTPPLAEQRAIALVLSSLDSKIELLRAQNETLEFTAQAIFKEWFVNFNFPGATGKMVDSELGEIPEGWRIGKLGEEVKTILGGTPNTEKKEYWQNGTIPWINSGKVNDFRIYEPSTYITKKALEESAAKLMPKGTVVIAITGATLGQISRLEIDSTGNQSVIGLLPNEKFSSPYLYYWMMENVSNIINTATGGAAFFQRQ